MIGKCICDTPQEVGYVNPFNLQRQCVIFNFVEIQKLIYKIEHTVDIHISYGKQMLVRR